MFRFVLGFAMGVLAIVLWGKKIARGQKTPRVSKAPLTYKKNCTAVEDLEGNDLVFYSDNEPEKTLFIRSDGKLWNTTPPPERLYVGSTEYIEKGGRYFCSKCGTEVRDSDAGHVCVTGGTFR